MKKTLIALAALMVAGSAMAINLSANTVVTNGVHSASGAYATSTGNGASVSAAGNSQTATSTVEAHRVGVSGFGLSYGAAGVAGAAVTTTKSYAGNASVGNATGSAAAGGVSLVTGSANAAFDLHGHKPEGTVSGSMTSVAQTEVSSGRNGLAVAGGINTVGFTASATATQTWVKNTAHTAANAGSASLSNGFDIGSGSVDLVNVGGDALANAVAKSGNVISVK